jgi:hypothetical protein
MQPSSISRRDIGKKKIAPGLIGLDIDGVVADTMEAFIRLARCDYGVDTIVPDDITAFEVEACLDLQPHIVDDIFRRLLGAPLESGLRPMEHAVEVLLEFAGQAPLTFITARPDHGPIADWLRYFLGDAIFANARLVAMGDHDDKGRYIRELGLTHFIDDRAETCVNLAAQGITALVFEQPWNRGRHELATVDNWLAIRDLCL